MKRNLRSIKPFLAGMFIALLLVFSTTNIALAVVPLPNDAGVAVTPHSGTILTNGSPFVITNGFGDGSLPTPAGVTATSSGTQTDRLYRDGAPSTCSWIPTFEVFNIGTIHYETYTFRAARSGCLNIDVSVPNTELYVAVYSGSYNPSNFTINGAGQQGSSGSSQFSLPVVAYRNYVLVVEEVNPGGGVGTTYSISLDNVSSPAVPISIWWILAAFVVIGGFAVYKFRLRRA
jgi:hypothetical protein